MNRRKLPNQHKSIPIFRNDQWNCFRWCVKNNIKIYPVPRKQHETTYEIEIFDNGTTQRSGVKYSYEEMALKLWELYCVIYDRNNTM